MDELWGQGQAYGDTSLDTNEHRIHPLRISDVSWAGDETFGI